MGLRELIEDLKPIAENLKMPAGDLEKENARDYRIRSLLKSRVILPEDFERSNSWILTNLYPTEACGDGEYFFCPHLSFIGVIGDLEMSQRVLKAALDKRRRIQLPKEVFSFDYHIRLDPDKIEQEAKFPADVIELCSEHQRVDEDWLSMDHLMTTRDEFAAEFSWSFHLFAKAKGKYIPLLREAIKIIKPEYVTLEVREDAKTHLLAEARKGTLGIPKERLEKLFTIPRSAQLNLLAGMLIGDPNAAKKLPNYFEITIPAKYFENFNKTLEGLFECHSSDSKIGDYAKIEQIIGFCFRDKTKKQTLGKLVKLVKEFNKGFPVEKPLISIEEAKRKIQEELGIIKRELQSHDPSERCYQQELSYSEVVYKWMDRIFRLHLGPEKAKRLSGLVGNTESFVKELQKEGYEPESINPDWEGCPVNQHGFYFYRQLFEEKSEETAKEYTQLYVAYQKPRLQIKVKRRTEGNKIRKTTFPKFGRFDKLGVSMIAARASQPQNLKYRSNKLLIWMQELKSFKKGTIETKYHFCSSINLHNPLLLPMQEAAIREMGIEIN